MNDLDTLGTGEYGAELAAAHDTQTNELPSARQALDAPSDRSGLDSALYAQASRLDDGATASADELKLDLTQAALDIAGIADPTGAADAASGLISISRGDWLGAGISAVGAILPYAGDAAKLGKLPKLLDTVDDSIALAKESPAAAAQLHKPLLALANILHRIDAQALPSAIGQTVETLRDKVDAFLSASNSASPQPPQDPKGKGKKGGDHLVNSGFGQTLSKLEAPQGNSKVQSAIDDLHAAVKKTDDIRVNKGPGDNDANSLAYGQAQQTFKNSWDNLHTVLNRSGATSADRAHAADAVVKSLRELQGVALDPEVAQQAVRNKVISRAELDRIAGDLDKGFDAMADAVRALGPRGH